MSSGLEAGGLLGFEEAPAPARAEDRDTRCGSETLRPRGARIRGPGFDPAADLPVLSLAPGQEEHPEVLRRGLQALALVWYGNVAAADPEPEVARLLRERLAPEGAESLRGAHLGQLSRSLEGEFPARLRALAEELGRAVRPRPDQAPRRVARSLTGRVEGDQLAQVLVGPDQGGAARRSLLVLALTPATRGCGEEAREVLQLEVTPGFPGTSGSWLAGTPTPPTGTLELEVDSGRLRADAAAGRWLRQGEGELPEGWSLQLPRGRSRSFLPLLAGWDPQLPTDRVPVKAFRVSPYDGHRYLGFDRRHAFARGRHLGTQVGPDGALTLAGPPGQGREGVWVSRPTRAQHAFRFAQVGFPAQGGSGGRVRVMVRGFDARGRPLGGWQQTNREAEVAFQIAAAFLQVMVWMMHDGNGPPPRIPGITVSTSPFGQGPGVALPPRAPNPGASRPSGPSASPNQSSGPAARTPSQPPSGLRYVDRAGWGASPGRGSSGALQPRSITVHHSAGPASAYRGASTIKGIQEFHQNTRGWSDVGYHYLIGPDGVVYEGRPISQVGAHSPPNGGRVGICLIGDFQSRDTPTSEAQQALVALLGYWFQQGISRQQVFGHRQQRSTSCPGDRLFQRLPQLVGGTR